MYLTNQLWSTARGLRVGQEVNKALELYGQPSAQEQGYLLWSAKEDPEDVLGMTVVSIDGVIKEIYIGEIAEY